MAAAFVGKFIVESRSDNFEAFMKGVGVPDEYIQQAKNAKAVTDVAVNGDVITITRTRPAKTTTNSFKLGVESEMETIKGDKVKATANLVEGKLVGRGENYEISMEMVDGKLKETITLKGHTMSRISVKQ